MNDKPEDQSENTSRPTLEEAIKGLDPTDDSHWTGMGKPSISHLSEATGTKVTKTIVDEAGFGDVNREQCGLELEAAEAATKAEEAPGNEAQAAEEKPEAPPTFSGDGAIDPAEDTAEDQAHVGGGEPDVRGPDDPPPAEEDVAKEPTLADDKRTGAVDPETGEPKISNEEAAFITGDPGNATPELLGAAIIKGLDRLALAMTAEVRTRQPELFQVFQLFAAERPSILERQKRLQLRQNQG